MMKQASSVVIIGKKADKVLILQRGPNSKDLIGSWNFPSGKLDENETPIQAAIREVKEETALIIRQRDLIKVCEKQYDELGVYVHHYIAISYDGELALNKESSDFKWINPEKISKLPFVPLPDNFVQKIRSTLDCRR